MEVIGGGGERARWPGARTLNPGTIHCCVQRNSDHCKMLAYNVMKKHWKRGNQMQTTTDKRLLGLSTGK